MISVDVVRGGVRVDARPVDVVVAEPVRSVQVLRPGPQGPANRLTIGTVTTSPPGGQAAAAVTGVPPVQVLDLTLPRGEPGPGIGGLLTAKGDLPVRDASNAVRLPVGADGMVLTASASASAGVGWANMVRTRRPNGDDRVVEVWDGTAWIVTSYDSGWRDVSGSMEAAGKTKFPNAVLHLHRTLHTVECIFYSGAGAVLGPGIINLLITTTGFKAYTAPGMRSGTGTLITSQSGAASLCGFYTNGSAVVVSVPNTAPPLDSNQIQGSLTFPALPSLPTSLPGLLATRAP